MIHFIVYVLTNIFSWLFYPCRYHHAERLPRQGQFILASNHISYLDPLVLGGYAFRYKFSYVAKESLFQNKFLGWVISQGGAFPIKRGTSDFRAIRLMLKRLEAGRPLILFPEGTRHAFHEGKRIQPGVGLIAKLSRCPVIPVFIRGTDHALPKGAKWLRRYPVDVYFGEPLYFSPQQSPEDIAAIIQTAMLKLNPSENKDF